MMKKNLKRSLAVLLAVFMLFPAVGLFASAEDRVYSVGDIIEYGAYPQTDVTETLGSILNAQSGAWHSYSYYSGDGVWYDGKMRPSDYMRYRDVVYNGGRYRGVTFDSCRPYCTGYYSRDNHQQGNGYVTENVYWFRFEPMCRKRRWITEQ